MCIYVIEYTKSVSDKIMGLICCVTTTTGTVLLAGKHYDISIIDDNITWLEASMPIIVGFGGFLIYNLIIGIKCTWKRQIPKNAVELV
jgi:hypothetical protein